MSTTRLFGLIYHLLNHEKATTSELAKQFEVSTRTITRDINTLSSIGVPIYTETGRNGGVYLLSSFVLDKVLLSEEERKNLLLALKGIRQLTPQISGQSLAKLQSLFKQPDADWLEVDFSTWHRRENGNDTFDLLKEYFNKPRDHL